MIIGLPLLIKGLYFLINRLASWFGVSYYFKKGYKHRKWRYFWAGVALSVLMFLALAAGFELIAHWRALHSSKIKIDLPVSR